MQARLLSRAKLRNHFHFINVDNLVGLPRLTTHHITDIIQFLYNHCLCLKERLPL